MTLQHTATQVLYNTIDAVLARGEKLDDLIDKSDSLSMQVYNVLQCVAVCCSETARRKAL